MVRAMGDENLAVLHCSDRVALQVSASARDVAEALSGVLDRWRAAASMMGLPSWEVIRAEVLTPAEFRRDCEVNQVDGVPAHRSS